MVKLKINLEKGAENEDKTAKSDDPVDGNSRQYCPRAEHCECIGEEEAHKGSNADAVNVLKRKMEAIVCNKQNVLPSLPTYLPCGQHDCTELCFVAHFGEEYD